MLPLIELARAYDGTLTWSPACEQLSVNGIATDSRKAGPGMMFVAVQGTKADGMQFAADAIRRGAAALLHEEGAALPAGLEICSVKTDNVRRAAAKFAARLYAPQPEKIALVTGTDGKTSTADFFRQLWEEMGKKSASIGTLGIISQATKSTTVNTTPDPVELHKTLQQLKLQGCDHVCIEASSIGLEQYRLDGITATAAAFTNLTRDHLDYHKTESAYFAAKRRLFDSLLPKGATAVLGVDDVRSEELKSLCHNRGHRVITFGQAVSDLQIQAIDRRPDGLNVNINAFGKPYNVSLNLVGDFQILNTLTAIGLAIGCGAQADKAIAAAANLKGVRGRLECAVSMANGARVYVDYAHTAAALAKALSTLRPHTHGKLLVVFGCGGDRDQGKRPEMGKAAAQNADIVVVTDDNPRSEDPALIRQQVLAGCPGAKEIGDRAQAIAYAINLLNSGDILIIAGKGHETEQIIGKETRHFDDAQTAREIAQSIHKK